MNDTTMQTPCPRPPYEALDDTGKPKIREARIVHELPTPQARHKALEAATASIEQLLDVPARRCIPFGAPTYCAFMEYHEAKAHDQRKVLFKQGSDLPLSLCPGLYEPASDAAS